VQRSVPHSARTEPAPADVPQGVGWRRDGTCARARRGDGHPSGGPEAAGSGSAVRSSRDPSLHPAVRPREPIQRFLPFACGVHRRLSNLGSQQPSLARRQRCPVHRSY